MSLIKQPNEPLTTQSIVTLLYGQPGIGKTTWSLSAPEPLLLDFDGGIKRVAPKDRKAYVPIKSWEDAIEVIQNEDLSQYKTLVIDTAGMALDFLSMKIIKDNPKLGYGAELSLKGFGKLKSDFRAFTSLCKSKGKHLVFVAHDRESTDGDNKYIRPDITGGSLSLLTREADLVGYMEALATRRTVSFTPTSRAYGKNTGGLPDTIELSKMSLSQVFSHYQNEQDRHIEILQDYNDLIAVIDSNIESIDSPESAREVAETLGNLEVIWDSKIYAQARYKDALNQAGIKYNAKTKEYETV